MANFLFANIREFPGAGREHQQPDTEERERERGEEEAYGRERPRGEEDLRAEERTEERGGVVKARGM